MISVLPLFWWIAPLSAIVALLIAFTFFRKLLRLPEGNETMIEIAGYVKEGAMAYLKQQYKVVAIVFGIIFILLSLMAFSGVQSIFVPFVFLSGGLWSAVSGYLGMKTATNASARTAAACQTSLNKGLTVSFRGGAIMGLVVVGFGLLDISIWFLVLNVIYDQNLFNVAAPIIAKLGHSELTPTIIESIAFQKAKLVTISNTMLTYAMGASVMALFARVGGGIFTKAADVGADLVGKVEAGIPEDSPKNPATIADNVGDNVGDVAGMGADLYESYCGSILAATALGASIAINSSSMGIGNIIIPMVVAAIGIICSLIGIFFIRTKEGATQKQLLHSLLIGTSLSAILVLASVATLAMTGIISWGLFGSVSVGLIAGFIIGQATEYYTSDTFSPTQKISESCKEGPATNILSGISTGMISTGIPVITIVIGIMLSFAFTGGFGDITKGIYGIAFAAIGMLSTLGIQLATDAFGPIADNAGGNAEMAGLPGEVREKTDALDSLGNTTAATGKGFAIGSAALTALALIAAYLDTIKQWLSNIAGEGIHYIGNIGFTNGAITAKNMINIDALTIEQLVYIFQINIINPKFLCGIFIGSMATFVFCALTISAVSKAAAAMVNEVRRQFREIKGILEGSAKPDYAQCVSISTTGSLKAMILPSTLAISIPIIVGLLFHIPGVLGLLTGTLTTGFTLAIMLNNAGGAWDNAKKYIEAGNGGGKGSDSHKAAVIGDTVGDPFKDTSGPSLNILIKLMTIVSIVFAGVILKYGLYF
ncbi:sodium-translocating pyrophosphatase [bacterium]|nr:sodium-translocating pyrophosphatase [Actinomycetota bacterium]MBE33471.1 sodium-translocating pyrophosphatase [bacterium]|tara:strand:- start:5824 stop:8124 length:2301 start_codon:yes stop_codon:yes gene_type:complete